MHQRWQQAPEMPGLCKDIRFLSSSWRKYRRCRVNPPLKNSFASCPAGAGDTCHTEGPVTRRPGTKRSKSEFRRTYNVVGRGPHNCQLKGSAVITVSLYTVHGAE